MFIEDLIAKWEQALADAQIGPRLDELSDESLVSAALATRSGLKAGDDPSILQSCQYTDCKVYPPQGMPYCR